MSRDSEVVRGHHERPDEPTLYLADGPCTEPMGRLRPGRTLYPLRQINESTKLAVIAQKLIAAMAQRPNRLRSPFSPPHPSWVHVVFQKV
jgi:hypothetical protein